MTPSSLLYAILSLQRGGGPIAWETCGTLLRWLPPDCDVIAATLAGSYLERRLQASVDDAHLFLHPTVLPAEGPLLPMVSRPRSGVPVTLADRDRDLRMAPPLPWPAIRARADGRLRTLDTLYAGTHRPGLIVIEDAPAAPSILAGARELLRQAPVIAICFASCPPQERAAIWERCAEAIQDRDYTWFDGLILPATTPERRDEAMATCANTVVCALPRALIEARVARGLFQAKSPEDLSVAAVAWNDWSSFVAPDRTRASQFAVVFDDALPAYGLHPAESDASGHTWRWTGPSAHSRFLLPMVAAGRWYLRLEVYNWGVASDASNVRVFIQGRPVASGEHSRGGARFGSFVITQPEASGVLAVDLITPPPRRASEDDPRRIGVNFSRCILERAA